MIHYYNDDTEKPQLDERLISAWIKQTAATYDRKTGQITYIFCSDQRILEVNRQFLQHDYYTDIITFDYGEGHTISGDIFISMDTVRSNAEQFGTQFDDELRRIIIHGILHLCGQNDKNPEDRAEMTRKENKALEAWNNRMGVL